ncbi:MAG: PAS/PAC sensor hybrid histidine kinase [uncultured bacterium]|nr:MAG: PAS/PAC sensor hybrid histidine kinase [uncultured bacterium]
MINGATDYVLKHKLERLVPAIKRALHERDLENMHIKSDGKIKLKNKKIEIQNKKLSQFNRDLILQNEENAKQAEELIVAKEMAEENDRLKTAFLQNMSHEIRTPLNGIIGFSDLLNSEDITRAEIISYTGIITQSGKRLMEIINNILDISRIQTGQIKIEKKLILINSLFFDLLSFFSPLARKKNINLSCPNLDNKGIILYSDELKLHQIFVNLINNAIKFTKSGEINFGCREEGDFVKFYVKDTGIGIPKELYDKIFDRFIQVEKSLSRDHEGAGLGLAISRGFVELLGGKIWVESEIGKNTTFYFNLPSVKDATNISSYVTLSD